MLTPDIEKIVTKTPVTRKETGDIKEKLAQMFYINARESGYLPSRILRMYGGKSSLGGDIWGWSTVTFSCVLPGAFPIKI